MISFWFKEFIYLISLCQIYLKVHRDTFKNTISLKKIFTKCQKNVIFTVVVAKVMNFLPRTSAPVPFMEIRLQRNMDMNCVCSVYRLCGGFPLELSTKSCKSFTILGEGLACFLGGLTVFKRPFSFSFILIEL